MGAKPTAWMLRSAKESTRELPGQPAFTRADRSSGSGAGTVNRTIEEYQHQHRDAAPNAAANTGAFRETANHYFGRCLDLLATESSVGGGPLRHRYSGCGKTHSAAPPEPGDQRWIL